MSLISRVEPLIMSVESLQLETESSISDQWPRLESVECARMMRKANQRYGVKTEPRERSLFKKD